MSDAILVFEDDDKIGRVASVDTSKVLIDAENAQLVTQIGVGSLVAILGSTKHEYLIGILERVTRSIREELIDEGDDLEDELSLSLTPFGYIASGANRYIQNRSS